MALEAAIPEQIVHHLQTLEVMLFFSFPWIVILIVWGNAPCYDYVSFHDFFCPEILIVICDSSYAHVILNETLCVGCAYALWILSEISCGDLYFGFWCDF